MNYVSIFADPAPRVCTRPKDAIQYPECHRAIKGDPHHGAVWGPDCPVHRRDRRDSDHELWHKFITMYIECGDVNDTYYLERALDYVSDTCPPDAPRRRKIRRRLRIKATPIGLVISLVRG